MITRSKTARGFAIVGFKDLYGSKCTLQQSSLAEKDALWLGITDPKVNVLASKAASVGVKTEETTGWVDYPLPQDVLISSRMHLGRAQVRWLIGRLASWLDGGGL